MKTLEQILTFEGGENCNFLDGRDRTRLARFVPVADWPKISVQPAEGVDPSTAKIEELTRDNIVEQLREDLAVAFEQATKRNISSALMFDVVKMWMWVLDDSLAEFPDYAYYGLPLFTAVANKYGLPNPLGDDTGNESKYNSSDD
jgi:hypothetical protein